MGGGKPGLKQRSKTAPCIWYRVYSGYNIHIHPQKISIPLQLTVGAISGPHYQPFHQSWNYMVRRKHSGKAGQLTLASGGSEHAQLSISWDNIMNFSLYVNMHIAGFCSDSYIYIHTDGTCTSSVTVHSQTKPPSYHTEGRFCWVKVSQISWFQIKLEEFPFPL